MNIGEDLFSAAAYAASPARKTTDAQERASELIGGRVQTVGNVLASANAAFYVAILSALAEFRAQHEFEPLFEDLREAILGDAPSMRQLEEFNADLRQLEEWKLVEKRIEKMRVHGYRDNKRQKFRFRICDDAASFIDWLRERREEDLNPRTVETDNLLGAIKSALAETLRGLNRMKQTSTDLDEAREAVYALQRADLLTDQVAQSLQRLDKRLDDFVRAQYDIAEAREAVDELTIFRDRFMNRIGRLRQEIMPEIEKLEDARQTARLKRCETVFREDTAKMRHFVSGRFRPLAEVLEQLHVFYGTDGLLQKLMRRVSDSARGVWKKLSSRLGELERRNHRLDDIQARLAEIAKLPEAAVPREWLRNVLQPAAMRGDMHICRDANEASRPPQPVFARSSATERVKSWVAERTDGPDAPRAISMDEARLKELDEWLSARGLKAAVPGETRRLSQCRVVCDDDFRKAIELARSVILGGGARAARIGVKGRTLAGVAAEIALGGQTLTFNELEIGATPD